MPSKAVAAKRRALRRKALKRSRARNVAKEELLPTSFGSNCGGSADSTTTSVENDAGEDDSELPVDKKIARAIRNRQAAQRSRVEAKAKMLRLAVDNDELAIKVESLRAENAALNKQLEALIAHSFGEGHNVSDVLATFQRTKSSPNLDMYNS
jgi:Basic region leucine zipper